MKVRLRIWRGWLLILWLALASSALGADRYINPSTGSDSDDGTTADLAWATLGQAATYMTANPGVVTRLLIDTSAAPLYVTSQPSFPDLAAVGQKCTITSATKDYADVRAWQLVSGATAVPYNTRYGGSGQSNIWVLVTRENATIWEYTGGTGDDLIWFDHLKNLITPSATYNNATNLSTLQSTPWTFWTGHDGTDYVTLFNPNGSPAARNFAVTRFVGQLFQVAGGYTLERLRVGGVCGMSASGTQQTGYSIHASNGCHVNDCIPYAGSTHAIGQLEGGSACTFNDVNIGVGPGWGGYTPFVFHSIQSTAQAPTLNRCRCEGSYSVRGSKTGIGTHATQIIAITAYCHGTATCTSDYIFDNCVFDGAIEITSDHANFNPRLVVRNKSEVGRITLSSATRAMTAVVNQSKLTKQLLAQSGHNGHSTTFTDCVGILTLPSVTSAVPGVRGTMALQNCTIRCPGLTTVSGQTAGRTLIRGTTGTVTTLSIHDSILELINSDGENVHLTVTVDLDAGSTITTNRNIYRRASTSDNLHLQVKSGGAFPSYTFTATQSAPLSQEANGTELTSNTLYLNSAGAIGSRDSIAIGTANSRSNVPDYTTKIFATRNDKGAFEWQDEPERQYTADALNDLMVPYASAHTLVIPLYEPGTTEPARSKSFGYGDIQLSKDAGAFANITTLPSATDANGFLTLAASAAEHTAKRIRYRIRDTSPAPEFATTEFIVGTHGSSAAQIASTMGGAALSPKSVAPDHIWRFDNRNSITASNNITEAVGSTNIIVAMDFSHLPTAIESVGTVTVADVSGETEPTITEYARDTSKRRVNVIISAASATDGTFTFSVPITTTDSQTFVRKGRLVLQ